MKTNPNDPANPISGELLNNCETVDFSPFGFTKREVFAMAAMQGYLASYTGAHQDPHPDFVAKKAVEYANALISELNKSEQ